MSTDERYLQFTTYAKKVGIVMAVFACTSGLYFLYSRNTPQLEDYMTLAFLDVGQGDAIYIRSPEGYEVLIDGGASRAVLDGLGRLMHTHDRTIDMLIATHPDLDHIGGLDDVFARYDIRYFIDSGATSSTQAFRQLMRAGEVESGVQSIQARAGQAYVLGASTTLHILYPSTSTNLLTRDTNASSIVALLRHGTNTILLTGDAPDRVEQILLRQYGTSSQSILNVDMLKLGHHGSKTSSAKTFLEVASPMWAIISSGKANRYGHPHPSIIHRLEQLDIPYLNTADEGHIIFHCSLAECVRR